MRTFSSPLLAVALGYIVGGCSGSDSNTPAGGGGSSDVGVGGSQATGGAAVGTGGAAPTGGVAPTGGNLATGGAPPVATGGNAAGGSPPATGGRATGGNPPSATGGKSTNATGGAGIGGSATGGTNPGPATGGQEATGGKSSAGGANGGAQPTGGKSATGGANGGAQATGGKSSAGGASATGGQANGGSTSAGGASAQSSGCGKTSTITSSQYNNGTTIAITAGGMQRRYILNIPTNYVNTTPYKLVVAYHALNSNDKSVYSEKYYGLLPLSNNTTIFVAPNGEQNGAGCTGTGTGESGCGWPNTSDHDMQLADAVVAQVEQNFCIDTNHIYATGWSYGASMSEQTACERPLGGTGAWGVRAVAVYAVAYLSNSTNCKASKPVAYYASHGTNDTVLQYSGGVSIAQTWAGVDGCTWATPPQATGTHICTKLTGCTAGYPLEFCSFVGPHTAYPDSGNESSSWGPQEVWTFLSQF